MTKIDSLRTDIRKAEKLRREIELRAEEATTEASKGNLFSNDCIQKAEKLRRKIELLDRDHY